MMRRLVGLRSKHRKLSVGLLTVAAALIWVVAAAADAPDPVDAANKAAPPIPAAHLDSFTRNANGTVTITVSGGWLWTTRGSSCTDDRAGVGYAVDWNDPTQVGNDVKTITFTENGQTITENVQVGAATANTRNPADNVAHPTRNSATGDFTGVVDPATPLTSWRGGCGTAPDSQGRYPEGRAGNSNTNGYTTPTNTRGVGTGTANGTDQSKLPRGTWGPISHTYRQASDITRICVITYDVHKGTPPDAGGGLGTPGGVKEVTAGGRDRNTDNGAEKNSGTPLGNACPSIPIPQPVIHVEKLPKTQTVAVGGIAMFRIVVSNNGSEDLTNVQISDAAAPNCGGSLATLVPGSNGNLARGQTVSYDCLSNAVPSTGLTNVVVACGDGAGSGINVCDDDTTTADTRTGRVGIEDLTSRQDVVPNDSATLKVDNPATRAIEGAINPQGTLTFRFWKTACGAGGTSLLGPTTPQSLDSNFSAATANTFKLSQLLGIFADTAGTYFWQVSYSGDLNADGTSRNAPFSECNESLTIDNGPA
jgi:uncharacterized repeat protein (TIGR01451 family)